MEFKTGRSFLLADVVFKWIVYGWSGFASGISFISINAVMRPFFNLSINSSWVPFSTCNTGT
jgi:hypothetical protein